MPTNYKHVIATIAAGVAASMLSSCYYDGGPPYNSYPDRSYNSGITSYGYGGYVGRPYYYDDYYYDGHYHRRDKDRVKLTAGQQRDKPNRPTGYHTREWYERRGYNLNLYKHKHENSGKTHEGDRYQSNRHSSGRSHSSHGDGGRSHSSHGDGGRRSSSSSGSNSSSSSSSSSNSSSGGGGSRRGR